MAYGGRGLTQLTYVECSQQKFNENLGIVYSLGRTIIFDKYINCYNADKEYKANNMPTQYFGKTWYAYLQIANNFAYLTYRAGNKWLNYKTSLFKDYEDSEYEASAPDSNGEKTYAYFRRFCKIEDCNIDIAVVSPYSRHNPKYVNKRFNNCIGYDRNKAYLGTCKNLLIPTKLIDSYRSPKNNEIGFNTDGIPVYGPCDTVCAHIFKAEIDEGMQKWVKFVTDKVKEDPERYKPYYQYAVGTIRRHNLPLYNTIIYNNNKFIEKYWNDEYCLWSTTDSLVSLKEIPELPLSDKPGDFKIEHTGDFAYVDTGYQWNYTTPSVKGLNKDKVKKYVEENNLEYYDILNHPNIKIETIKKWDFNGEYLERKE